MNTPKIISYTLVIGTAFSLLSNDVLVFKAQSDKVIKSLVTDYSHENPQNHNRTKLPPDSILQSTSASTPIPALPTVLWASTRR